ncbi:hypothetical protein [Levilactobacillus parabrevis]|uniref:hypothetical protein n=1 Tax=Levilactobacillus parabrevis TaxID=357278 RepID=UPI003756FF11
MKSETFLKEHLDDYFMDGLLISPDIPEKKLITASHKIANDIDPEYILGIFDTGVFKNAKEGIVFTGDSLYIHEGALGLNVTQKIAYDQVISAKFEKRKNMDDKGKIHPSKNLTINLKDEDTPIEYESNVFPLKPISNLLNAMNDQVDDISATNQHLKLSDLSPEVILGYLELIVNFLKRDGMLDQDEYANLAGLIGTIDIQTDTKTKLMKYRLEKNSFRTNDELVNFLRNEVPTGSQITIFQSLVNNMLSMMSEESKNDWQNIPEFTSIQQSLSVSNDQVNFYLRKQQLDQKIIKEKLNDDDASKLTNNLMSLGSGVGASVAAFGVTGFAFGAFGELGLGTLAFATISTGGLALAVTGIGVASIAGYEGMKRLSGNQTVKEATRNSLLQAKIVQQNSAMALLMSDINYISERISELVNAKNTADMQVAQSISKLAELKSLIEQLRLANSANTVARDTQERNQHELALSALPKFLEVEKVEDLLNQSLSVSKFSALLEHCYHFKNDGNNQLDESVTTQYLSATNEVLEEIGYYKVSSVANAKNIGKKGLNFLNNLG